MELLLLFILMLAMLGLWIAQSSIKTRLTRIEWQIDQLTRAVPPPETVETAPLEPVPAAQAAAPEPLPESAPEPMPERVVTFEWRPEDVPAQEAAAPSESLGQLFERLVAGKLLIWLGGVALVLAAIFLIRYSIEVGLMTPAQRMTGAGLFGLLLLGLGEYARASARFGDDPRIAQVFVGAGIAVLYATAYGSHILYGLIGSGTASGAMLAVTAAALVLSLRHGAPTAIMGLIGGFLTPLLVGNPDAGAVPLLAYLALLDLAVFVIAWRRDWTWLAAAAVALSYVWTAFLLSRPPDDALASGLFVVLLSLVAALVRPGSGRQLSLIQPLLIGLVQLFLLVARVDLGLQAWILFGALAAAAMVLAELRRDYRLAPPLALLLALVLLAAKATTGQDALVPDVAAGMILLFGGGGLGLALWRRYPLWTGIAVAGAAGPYYILRIARPELLTALGWGLIAAFLALVPALLVWANRDRAGAAAAKPRDPAPLAAAAGVALLLGAAIWDLVPPDWIAAAWIALALAMALAARRIGGAALGLAALATAVVGAARCLWAVLALIETAMGSLFGIPALPIDLPDAMLALAALAVPAVLLAALDFSLPPAPGRWRRSLLWLAGLFGIAALYVWFKQAFGLASIEDFHARGLLERMILTQALFAAGWLLASGRIGQTWIAETAMRRAGVALTALAAARLLWFDMLYHCPAWAHQWVGPLPVLNLIVPAYLLSAVWLYAARRRAAAATRSGLWLAAFLAALVVGVALLVRQAFQGPFLDAPGAPIGEYYGYSLAGIVVAIGLIVAGMRLADKALRIAGLLLLTATILKVFLIDAAALKGLFRILSFLGLGIALIGIGRLYGPVLRAERDGA